MKTVWSFSIAVTLPLCEPRRGRGTAVKNDSTVFIPLAPSFDVQDLIDLLVIEKVLLHRLPGDMGGWFEKDDDGQRGHTDMWIPSLLLLMSCPNSRQESEQAPQVISMA